MSTLPKVCSYMRSGTHFLMASIYMNFEVGDVAAPVDSQQNLLFFINHQESKTIPWAGLFGSHKHLGEAGIDPKIVIYIYREPKRTLESLHKLMGSKEPLEKFIAGRLDEWYRHVEGYKASSVCVSYEQLLSNFNFQIERIGNIFNLKRKPGPIRKPPHVGWKRIN